MKKIKNILTYIIQLIVNPFKKLASIPISDKFIEFTSKHVWLRLLLSLLLTAFITLLVYYIK